MMSKDNPAKPTEKEMLLSFGVMILTGLGFVILRPDLFLLITLGFLFSIGSIMVIASVIFSIALIEVSALEEIEEKIDKLLEVKK